MYWADKVAKQIIDSGEHKPYWVDDMFTPSGYAHLGSLRGPLVHDLVYRALLHAGQKVTFTYVINDFDPIDGLAPDLQANFSEYLGFPLRQAPSPEPGYDSFAAFFASDYQKSLANLGVHPEYRSSWEMYHQGLFNDAIKVALDNAEKIQDIYAEVSGSRKKESGWLPLQVICQNCGKLGTTRVYEWNGETVAYKCEPEMVKWAKGCGYEGRISPFDGNGKLPWKVDWPSHWKVLGVTIEGEGKDHSSAGGSRDIARELCQQILNYPEPFDLPYEFFLIGGKKMASSKGLGLKARELVELVPLNVGRFLFCRADYRQAVEFNPVGTMAIPDLFDEYDRCFKAYIENGDETLSRTFAMSQVNKMPPKEPTFLPRFRDVVNFIQQPSVDLKDKFTEEKGNKLNEVEQEFLNERIKYAKIWLKKYAPAEFRLHMSQQIPAEAKNLEEEQKQYLLKVVKLVEKDLPADELQQALYDLTKEQGIAPKKAFAAIYISFIGKEFGPKAGAFLQQYPKDQIIARLKEVSE